MQQKTDPWRPDCGNGVRPDGTNVTGNYPPDTSKRITPSSVRDWMRHLIRRYAAASAQAYRYGVANPQAIVRQTDQTVGAGGFNATYPAYSITLIVVPEGR